MTFAPRAVRRGIKREKRARLLTLVRRGFEMTPEIDPHQEYILA